MDEFKGIIEYCIGELIDNALKELKQNDQYSRIDSKNDKLMAKIEKSSGQTRRQWSKANNRLLRWYNGTFGNGTKTFLWKWIPWLYEDNEDYK